MTVIGARVLKPHNAPIGSHGSRSRFLFILVILVAVWLNSCTRESAAPDADAYAVTKTYERGPITLKVMVDRDQVTIADTIRLVLHAEVDEGYEVEMPKFGENLEQFGIVDFLDSRPKLAEQRRIAIERSYKLEPFLSGEYTIPSMTVTFRKPGESDTESHEVQSEPITIKVASLLPEDQAKLDIKEIAPPVRLPGRARWPYYAGFGASAALLALACGVLWRRRRKRAAPPVPIVPPHERALNALDALLAEKLVERGEYKLFYIGVSDILRRFIEERYGLHAPERTTEEFLAELGNTRALERNQKLLLRDFLKHCDLVKFAEYQPSDIEVEQTFSTCKRFIQEASSSVAATDVRMIQPMEGAA